MANTSHETSNNEPLVPTFIPALICLLLNLEKKKGSPLTETEVVEARDEATCIILPLSKKHALEEARGYKDIDPENVWQEWLDFKSKIGEKNDRRKT